MGSILGTLARAQADGLDCNAAAHIDEQFARQLRNAGYEFHVWTVNDPAVAVRFQRLGVDSITTDRPAVIRKALTQASVAVP
jgi:glycerophosphoryl diester phosphodiesterase